MKKKLHFFSLSKRLRPQNNLKSRIFPKLAVLLTANMLYLFKYVFFTVFFRLKKFKPHSLTYHKRRIFFGIF